MNRMMRLVTTTGTTNESIYPNLNRGKMVVCYLEHAGNG